MTPGTRELGYFVPGQGTQWLDVVVSDIRDDCAGVRRITLDYPHRLPAHDPGAHIKVQLPAGDKLVSRSYSIVGIADSRRVTIAVRLMENGFGGSRAMHALEPGATLRASDPTNHFRLLPGAPFYQLIAGGIGVTPIIGMARALKAMKRPFRILYLGRHAGAMPLLGELQAEFAAELTLHFSDADGFYDFAPLVAGLPEGSEAYMCGPKPMMDAVIADWAAQGHAVDLLRFETFGAASDKPASAFRVLIPARRIEVEVRADQTMLEALEQAGAEPLYFCQRGECGLCVVDILEKDGDLDHRDVFFSPDERAQAHQICTCVSRATGTLSIDMP